MQREGICGGLLIQMIDHFCRREILHKSGQLFDILHELRGLRSILSSVLCHEGPRPINLGCLRVCLCFRPNQQGNAMETITSPPTLPATWQPTASSCISSSDYWAWDYGSDSDRWVVLGGPSQTTDCLPTSWASDVVYSGEHCPQKYTSACQGTDSSSAITCCPKYVLLR